MRLLTALMLSLALASAARAEGETKDLAGFIEKARAKHIGLEEENGRTVVSGTIEKVGEIRALFELSNDLTATAIAKKGLKDRSETVREAAAESLGRDWWKKNRSTHEFE